MNTETFDPRDSVIEEFLDGQPRAATWRELRAALQTRLDAAKDERDAAKEGSPERKSLDERVAELQTQVRVLAEEEAITGFVEESVRNSLSRPRPHPMIDYGDDAEEY